MGVLIREARASDWPAIWDCLEPVIRSGEVCVYPSQFTSQQARQAWLQFPLRTFVCVDENGEVIGSYYLKASHPGNGSHVGSCDFVVKDYARGFGVGTEMCRHAQAEATAHGFHSLQFNLVVSTNHSAVRLWERLGFAIVGRLPSAFRHSKHGFVDAFVMYKALQHS